MPANPHRQTRHALKQADRAARRGDLAAAERWSRTAERMAEAAHKLARAEPPLDDPNEAEAIRAELRERFRRLSACNLAIEAWERERQTHERICAEARSSGAMLPPPLAPAPFTEDHLRQIGGETRSNARQLPQ